MSTEDDALNCRTLAVVGLSPKEDRDSHRVARYMQERGYRIIPVIPAAASVLGETSYPDLKSVPDAVDVVVVFRRSEEVLPIGEQAVGIGAKVLWMQEGVINEEAATRARDAGVGVVMDKCIMQEHRRLKGRRR